LKKRNFKLALIQMKVRPGQKPENLRHAVELIAKAVAAGASVVVLPEAMPLGWTDPSAKTDADEIPAGCSCSTLRAAARQMKVYVCSGLVERCGNRVFNAAVLINPRGEVILHHRKVHELEVGREFYAIGDRLGVAHTPFGTFGIMICADAFCPGQVISRALGRMGAQVLLSPSSWAVPLEHDNRKEPYGQLWLDNYRPVAREFGLWIAGVSNVGWITAGPWQGRKCIGCSLGVGPSGRVARRGPYGPDAESILEVPIALNGFLERGKEASK
jgi:predicted amidohydrolase